MKRTAEFLFEVGMLKKAPRSGYQFLGSGGESVADHSFRTTIIGYILASRETDADRNKVILMCLFHDLAEARTGDHNYVHKKYVTLDEEAALRDQLGGLRFGQEIMDLVREFNQGKTIESLLSKDADQLDLVLELKEQLDKGNDSANDWLSYAIKRLHTQTAREMAREILSTHWTEWWFDKKTDWWVNGPENR